MSENYPKVTIEFLVENLKKSPKVIEESFSTMNDTMSFVCKGNQPIYKRSFIITSNSEMEVNFIQATGLAIRFGFMGELLEWYEKEKYWKEGGYVVR